MSLDSSANLLFNIGADTSDAEGNIARFRSLLSKDLDGMGAEFEQWSQKVFGSITTVQGALTAGAAAMAAGIVALASAAVECGNKYEEFVSSVGDGVKKTGIAAEQMSALRYAANATGTSYEGLINGITRLEAATVKANATDETRLKMAQLLGTSTATIAAGERNIMPVLEATMNRFQSLASGTERAALARELFSRNGAELLGFLKLGSDGLKRMADEAERLGLVITMKDIVAVKEHKAAVRMQKEELEALTVTIGRYVMPAMTAVSATMIGLAETIRQYMAMDSRASVAPGTFFLLWAANARKAMDDIRSTVRGMNMLGDDVLKPVNDAVKKETENWYGFSQALEGVNQKLAAQGTEEQRIQQEFQHLQFELQKTGAEMKKLQDEGKLGADVAARETRAAITLAMRLPELMAAQLREIDAKRKAAADQAHEDLLNRLDAQATETIAHQEQHWNDEIDKLRASYEKKKELTAENEGLIEQIRAAGLAKLRREQVNAFEQQLVDLQNSLATIVSAQMTASERLSFQYDIDLANLQKAQARETDKLKEGSAERLALEQQYQINREALLQKFGRDMTALQNTQGWQGVFGSKFGQLLQHDQAAAKQWAESIDQALEMVGLRMTALKGLGEQAFQSLAQAMGQNIASAIVYSQSIGQAMQAALAATLESIAAESLVQGLYAAALGFVRLAQHDYPAATAAFTSAAMFGAIGGAAAVAGRMIAPSQATAAAGSASSAAGGTTSTAAAASNSTASSTQNGPLVSVIVQGHVFGPGGERELLQILNEAVTQLDMKLYATATTTGAVVRR